LEKRDFHIEKGLQREEKLLFSNSSLKAC